MGDTENKYLSFSPLSSRTAGYEKPISHLEVDWKRDISTGLATKGKGRENPTKRRQTKSSTPGGDCGDYDYDEHYNIKHSGRLQQQPKNPGH